MRHPLSLFIIALMTATTVVMGAVILSNASLVQAQGEIKPEIAALQVYERLPDFPKENQYQRKRKKAVATDNTLVSRLIRYHIYSQSRSPQYRLDWKLTLADYLGVNEYMTPKTYPGAAFLKSNPIERDQSIIQSLQRDDRNELINTIVGVFDPELTTGQSQQPIPSATPSTPTSVPAVVVPSESATDLLIPTNPNPTSSQDQPTGAARFLIPDEAP